MAESIRNMRPAWLTASIIDLKSGSIRRLATGPRRSKDTSMLAEFFAKIEGKSIPFLDVQCITSEDGKLARWRVTNKRTGHLYIDETVLM